MCCGDHDRAETQSTAALHARTRLRTDMGTRAAYTSDASIFRRVPAAILEPRTVQDIRDGLAIARAKGWSVVGRGGGTSVAGNAIGEGLIIDTSRHFHRILDIDPEARTATVEPGVVCDQLREAVAEYGLTYGPDPSTHSRCTIGGMVANNACGSHSVAWGTAAENLLEVTLMLADGREVTIGDKGCDDPEIDAALRALAEENAEIIEAELGRFPRQVSGYGLHYLRTHPARALAGTEGTVGIMTRLKVSLVPVPRATALAVLAFDTVFDAAAAAPQLRLPGVTTIEGMGGDLLAALRSKNGQDRAGENLPGVGPEGAEAGGWLFCEVGAETAEEAWRQAAALVEKVPVMDSVVVDDAPAMRALWHIRESAAGIVTRLPDGGEAWPNWEDSAVPPENLADYLRDLYALMAKHEYEGIPFGHFGEGCVHVRISFDFASEAGIERFRTFMVEAAQLVSRHGGSLSGEHGDGRARSALLSEMYSPEMRRLFERFSLIFDPDRIFNPGVLVWAEPVTQGLRMDPGQAAHVPEPRHLFPTDEGSLRRAINRCVGVGACRSMSGAMCPSFQITHDEVHSTRGRARILSEVMRGETLDGFSSTEAREALDLCLSCRACAHECPVNVDMASLKAEFLSHHYQGKLRPRAHYLMGLLPFSMAILHRIPGAPRVVDALMRSQRLAPIIARVSGLDHRRPLIRVSPVSLRRWWRRDGRSAEAAEGTRRVVLWPDSFSASLDTRPAQAAVSVLRTLGVDPVLPSEFVCCGLTLHSTGQVDGARAILERSARVMAPYLDEGLQVIGLEPSCTVMLRKEATGLSTSPEVARLAKATTSFGEFIAPLVEEALQRGEVAVAKEHVAALTQVHCHERSLGDPSASRRLLEALGVEESQIETGCCGLAGNWGFEPGHAELSRQLGERELFPRVRAARESAEREGTRVEIIADGFSCRTQVEQGTGERARHIAEVLDTILRPAP
ncbi:FAD-binding oxidoreductase [Corynebacterium uropygiale]|uniref:FAD-binding oxidoreductase n=1 Tax=Corynebacterium uropygiale TaxID=1775911 RepID=A0A9X1U075_9CORY|nr:FAD-binding and (Fe-S)-binding domain-containing protein [Corynebacterium uropygiale]MCF4006168.1 FAD-binding oxidoreductase [Corynebacterium uropygiale]